MDAWFLYLYQKVMQKLVWKNLLQSKCPKCGKALQFFPLEEMLMCSITCGFMIREEKMKQMVGKMLGSRMDKRPTRMFEDNQTALNNLGSKKIQDYEEDDLY